MNTSSVMTVLEPDRIVLAHGGGGELTRGLIAEHVLPRLGNRLLDPLMDSAVVRCRNSRLAFTTDAFVVQPLEFPGGDIGRLAVCGTVNDLAVMGAQPAVLSLALVIHEGVRLDLLDRVLDSIAAAAREAHVVVATGDTKVIDQHSETGLIITTAGIGWLGFETPLGAGRIARGDEIVITGAIAEHGLAVMCAREALGFKTDIRSDVAPLNGLLAPLTSAELGVRFMRDPTRGGVAGVLADLAEETGLTIEVQESAIPITRVARHAAEMLGLDPLTIANEGKCMIVCAPEQTGRVLELCRAHPLGRRAQRIGRFTSGGSPVVELITRAGGRRLVQRPYGEELPRIC